MVHRRVLNDDALGVGEALNESAFGEGLVVRGRHSLIVDAPATSALVHRVSAQNIYMHPLAVYSLPQQTFVNYSAAYRLTWSALTDVLPLNLHLLTFDQLGAKDYLVRVEHYFELNEDATYSTPITFDLQSLFQAIGTISNTVELTLAANLPVANLQRLNWTTTDGASNEMKVSSKFNK
jgi:lysosomal alpha-mannosidase